MSVKLPEASEELLRNLELLARVMAISGAIGMGLVSLYKWYGKQQ